MRQSTEASACSRVDRSSCSVSRWHLLAFLAKSQDKNRTCKRILANLLYCLLRPFHDLFFFLLCIEYWFNLSPSRWVCYRCRISRVSCSNKKRCLSEECYPLTPMHPVLLKLLHHSQTVSGPDPSVLTRVKKKGLATRD